MTDNIGRDKIKSYAERLIRLLEEAEALSSDIKEVRGEAKAEGYSVKALNAAIKRARMSAEQREEADQFQMVLDLYCDAIMGAKE